MKIGRKTGILALGLVFAGATLFPVSAATYHVSSTGNDSNDGTTAETPFLTPAKAIEVAGAGDEILLARGLYPLAGELVISKAVAVRGEDRDTTVLQAAPGKRAISITAAGAVLSSLTVTDGSCNRASGANVRLAADGLVTNCVLRNGQTTGNGTGGSGIWLTAGMVVDTIVTNNFSNPANTSYGGAVYVEKSGIVERCLVAYNHSSCDGIHTHGVAGVYVGNDVGGSVLVRDCTIARNQAYGFGGIYFTGSTHALCTNSIIAWNRSTRNTAPCHAQGGKNGLRGCVVDQGGLSEVGFTNETGLIDFVDPEGGDWRPRLTSTAYRGGMAPCAGAFSRIPTGAPECDFSALVKKGIAPFKVSFVAAATNFPSGGSFSYTWVFGDGSEPLVTDRATVSHEYLRPGEYDVSLEVSSAGLSARVSYSGEVVVVPRVLHVTAINAGASRPYDSWANAATNLESALDHAADGCTILVDDGILPVRDGRSVLVTKGVTIRSRSGDPRRSAIGRYDMGRKFRVLEINHEDAILAGLTIENGYVDGGNEIGGTMRINKDGGLVTNCVIRGGTVKGHGSGGAGISLQGGLLVHSVISNNLAEGKSVIANSGAVNILDGTVDCCLIAGNRSTATASLYYPDVAGVNVTGGSLRNSTVVQNEAWTCGGVWIREGCPGQVVNCLIACNSSLGIGGQFDNCHGEAGHFSYCATEEPIEGSGPGCVSGDLLFADSSRGDFTPVVGSVAIGRGLVEEWMATGRDLAGNNRLGADGKVDIGAYEGAGDGLAASLTADRLTGAAPQEVSFSLHVAGAQGAISVFWDLDGDGTTDRVTTALSTTWSYLEPGSYTPSARVSDGAGQSVSVVLLGEIRVSVPVVHVVSDPSFEGSVAPYASWETAATSIHDAIAVAGDGTRIVLRAGDYPITEQIRLVAGESLESETGIPGDVVIRRGTEDDLRLVWLDHPSSRVSGLTFADGRLRDDSGANIYVGGKGGMVTNCVIRGGAITWGNAVTGSGIRLDAGLATHCVIEGNRFFARGNVHTGGSLAVHHDGCADTCLIVGNISSSIAGGKASEVCAPVHCVGGTIRNCTITGNVSSNGYAGLFYYKQGNHLGSPVVIENCLIARNRSLSDRPHADLANDDALALMSHCASDVEPGEKYRDNCLYGPVIFKDPEQGDYRPVPPSVGLHKAIVTDAIRSGAVDLLGCPFLRGRRTADIGAYHGYGVQPLILFIR